MVENTHKSPSAKYVKTNFIIDSNAEFLCWINFMSNKNTVMLNGLKWYMDIGQQQINDCCIHPGVTTLTSPIVY